MEPSDRHTAHDSPPRDARVARGRRWAAALEVRRDHLTKRAEAERRLHPSVDAVYDMVDRDAEVGGGIIACALAYRLFIWLLPVALVVVAGLGLAADASSGSPEEAAAALGFEGLVTSSIANAAESPNRWYALLIGVPLLVWATRSLLRALIGAHRLVWGDVRTSVTKPTIVRSLEFLGLLLCLAAVSAAASALRSWSTFPGLAATVVAVVPYAGLWLVIALRLPHGEAPWTALVPGALVYGVGTEIVHGVIAYVITPWALAKQGTYGALGLAAALLLCLFLISRLVVSSAVVNATLWERSRTARPRRSAGAVPLG